MFDFTLRDDHPPRPASGARLKAMAHRLATARDTDPAAIVDYIRMARASLRLADADRRTMDELFLAEASRKPRHAEA